MKALSMGAGVQTTACLIHYDYDHVIFADTGDERPETYAYIEKYLKPYCKSNNTQWHTVKKPGYDSLMQYCVDKKTLPIMATRWCTREFKIQPINRKLRELGARKRDPAQVHIGISIDESHRLGSGAFVDKPQYQHKVYPLIEDKISRADCYKIIEEFGWEPPMKSGCDYCPFRKRSEIMALRHDDPERFKKIVHMESSDRKGRKLMMNGKPLQMNQMLDDYDEEEEEQTCDSGHCFV